MKSKACSGYFRTISTCYDEFIAYCGITCELGTFCLSERERERERVCEKLTAVFSQTTDRAGL